MLFGARHEHLQKHEGEQGNTPNMGLFVSSFGKGLRQKQTPHE
jgi:hypothetical protein